MNPFGPGVFCFRSLLITDSVSLSDVGLFRLLLLVMLLLCFESCSVVLDSATPWTVQSMEFSRSEYWRWVAFSLLQGIFPTQGLNPGLPALQVDSLTAEPPECWQIVSFKELAHFI